ncbi:unnamed protein product [Blepharisma stoltei]|uniref:Importin subunit alpha n=1 Tax=Blepharisma stoltei TaxID=1481888 RepID=A0AAU9JAP3_9CILI|nr:unnamed protein product [Blepharisma stoltei]
MSKYLDFHPTRQMLNLPFSTQKLNIQKIKGAIEKSKTQRSDLADAFRKLSISTQESKSEKSFYKSSYEIEDIPELVEALKNPDDQSHLFAAQGFRKILSLADPHISEVLRAGILPYTIEWIQRYDFPELQMEGAWILTNISYGDHEYVELVVNSGALPLLINLMNSENEDVRDQAIWALGNLCGDTDEYRQLAINLGGLNELIRVVKYSQRISTIREGCWAISNICIYKFINFQLVEEIIPLAANFLNESQHSGIISDCILILARLCEGCEESISLLLKCGNIIPKIIWYLTSNLTMFVVPSLRVIRAISTDSSPYLKNTIKMQIIPILSGLLDSDYRGIRKDSAWCLAKLCTAEYLDTLFVNSIFTKITNLISTENENLTKRQFLLFLTSAVSACNTAQMTQLIQMNLISTLCGALRSDDKSILTLALESLMYTLTFNRQSTVEVNQSLLELIDECGGCQNLEDLRANPNIRIQQKLYEILNFLCEAE